MSLRTLITEFKATAAHTEGRPPHHPEEQIAQAEREQEARDNPPPPVAQADGDGGPVDPSKTVATGAGGNEPRPITDGERAEAKKFLIDYGVAEAELTDSQLDTIVRFGETVETREAFFAEVNARFTVSPKPGQPASTTAPIADDPATEHATEVPPAAVPVEAQDVSGIQLI